MFIGIDIGGSKTLVASFQDDGKMNVSHKFPTPQDYTAFIPQLAKGMTALDTNDFNYGGLAMPATHIDREGGIGISFGNLPWRDVPIQHDVEALVGCPFAIDNDAKLGALSEASLLQDTYSRVLYVTVSTGIGYALVDHGIIDENIGDAGGKSMLFEFHGKLTPWEEFASGKAIVARYGKRAEEISDPDTWQRIVHDLSYGLIQLIAVMQPEVIVIGGSVGTYFPKYGDLLNAELARYEVPLLPLPTVIGAQHPEEAVVYGCYDLAKAHYEH